MVARAAEGETRVRRRRHVLRAQGIYYMAAGIWPLIHFNSFAEALALPLHPFQAHVLGAVLVVIGGSLLESVRREIPGTFPTLIGVSVAAAIAFVELVWLPRLSGPTALWFDLAAQLAIVASLLVLYPKAVQTRGRTRSR